MDYRKNHWLEGFENLGGHGVGSFIQLSKSPNLGKGIEYRGH